ncbi:hypothetical protein ACX9VS_07320 [Weissella paramesenteroides]|jgi:hypothetical protein|uniref:hypothetical protein n=1 Tax=Weissella paramesenteroides TaxID=1249 RepID=UPI00123C5A7E|nr:hypothetical protein [Weissella paramesenteroides]KAA8445077.1 hypothetical protein FKV72_07975 [Weissella paramesenteroides]KAA8452587.1 hypothetical protein FKV71_04195 [Weissella paramesenteroides]MCS9984172.1 hypothetical protein [Weissella paramesenteroides]MCS9998780.1 hypothetical protein [Weissella paramesenteroides]MCT0260273.1 hypothetical protein [Weissella paramesenteroides]
MAFDPQLTIEHGTQMNDKISKLLEDTSIRNYVMLTKLADYVRYYADLEDENVLSDIEDLRREVADIPIADNPEERISSLEDEVAELKQCIQGLKAGN